MYTGAMQQTISIFWQVPQYFFITLGEVLFCATGYEFSYAEVSCLVSSFFHITNTFKYSKNDINDTSGIFRTLSGIYDGVF